MNELSKLDLNLGLIKASSTGVIEFVNDAAVCILNMEEEVVGKQISEVIPVFLIPKFINEPQNQILSLTRSEVLVTSCLTGGKDPTQLIVLLQELEKLSAALGNFTLAKQTQSQMDFLLEVMQNDVTITDGKGIVLRVSRSYEQNYGVQIGEVIGKSVFELEKQGVFIPSATVKVLKEKRKVSILQKNKIGNTIMVTAVPVFNKDSEIEYVISYDAWDIKDLVSLKEKYEKLQTLIQRQSTEIKELRQKEMQFPEIIAKSSKMQNIIKLALKVAEVDANLLITGESGVGKNLIARLIHKKSVRSQGPYIEINCGAIPESLIESELFGYEKGSFTGASSKGKLGQIELAHGGTLFLDELGELPLNMQVKLLKVIQERNIVKVGGTQPVRVDFRLIAATNKDLKTLVQKGLFREDLYYRLNVVPIHIPPLRERPEDILPLALYFLAEANKKYKKNKTLAQKTIERLLKFSWPGNVRELENTIERLVLTSEEDTIGVESLPDIIPAVPVPSSREGLTLKQALELYEEEIIKEAYRRYKTSVGVGKALGISQPSAVRKLQKYNIIQK